jgi:DegV family protein with EDD domain
MPLEWYAQHDIRMVPLKVRFGEEEFLDWIELGPVGFYARLPKESVLPKTSQPSPADFTAAYEDLASHGATEIVSIHLSGPLSGTVESAHMAAEKCSVPVHVVDTKKVTVAVALCVCAALEARDAGKSGAEVAEAASKAAASCRLFFLLDTLEYLVKGGRAGKAQGLAASLLNIKPILEVNADGIIEPFKKIRGEKAAREALIATVVEDSERLGRLRVGLLHACHPERVAQLHAELSESGADLDIALETQVGAVIGTYAGPGALGIAYYPLG